jgi:hypothetical protein
MCALPCTFVILCLRKNLEGEKQEESSTSVIRRPEITAGDWRQED